MSDTENIYVRVNGRGNAWPVFLGGSSKFYNAQSSNDLAGASYSLISSDTNKQTNWEVLIDAGHHTAPFLIKNGNRIPEAIVLTHGHMDHTLGIDWVAQSKYFLSGQKAKYPLYATLPVWEFVKQSYPHLSKIIDFRELTAGVETSIQEVDGLKVTAFPVYHGESAKGASMLFFNYSENNKVLFTGDMLCPLLRKKDYHTISQAQAVFIDSNNRYPYPLSNHGSITRLDPKTNKHSSYIEDWLSKVNMNYLVTPHCRSKYNEAHHNYFDELLNDFPKPAMLPLTIIEFAQRTQIQEINLVHYGAMEDKTYYNQEQLTSEELEHWANQEAIKSNLNEYRFIVPKTGYSFNL